MSVSLGESQSQPIHSLSEIRSVAVSTIKDKNKLKNLQELNQEERKTLLDIINNTFTDSPSSTTEEIYRKLTIKTDFKRDDSATANISRFFKNILSPIFFNRISSSDLIKATTASASINPTASASMNSTASASIWIATTESAYIGDPSTKRFLPTYLENRGDDAPVLTFENGDPIPLDSKDFLIPCTLFDVAKGSEKLGLEFGSPLWLPSVLFSEEVKEGSAIKLRFGETLIELVIKQEGHNSIHQHDSIQDALKSCQTHAQTKWEIDGTTAFSSELHPFYRLGEKGTFYGLDQSAVNSGSDEEGQRFELKKKELHEWRSLDAPEERGLLGTFRSKSDGIAGISILAILPGFQSKHIDIVLNETRLIFYARSQDGPRFDISQASMQDGDQKILEKLANGDQESITYFKWKECAPLKDFTLEEMQAMLSKGKISLSDDGILTVTIPTT